jgi:hypothetical protein
MPPPLLQLGHVCTLSAQAIALVWVAMSTLLKVGQSRGRLESTHVEVSVVIEGRGKRAVKLIKVYYIRQIMVLPSGELPSCPPEINCCLA